MTSDWAMVLITGVYVLATIIICYYNAQSATASRAQTEESKRQHEADSRARIVYELVYERKAFYGLRITNVGKRVANHVEIDIDTTFTDSLAEPSFVDQLKQLSGKQYVLGINQSYTIYFGSNKFRGNLNMVPLNGKLVYEDYVSKYSEPFSVDLTTYATIFSTDTEWDDLMKFLKNQQQSIEKMSNALNCIAKVVNRSALIAGGETEAQGEEVSQDECLKSKPKLIEQ